MKTLTINIYVEILDITIPASPSLISSTQLNYNYGGDSMNTVLSPDDNTLIVMFSIAGFFALDVSDPQNPTVFQSKNINADQAVFSPDSKTLFLVSLNSFRIGQLWVNKDLELKFMPANPVVASIDTNKTANTIVLSDDGRTAFVACDDGLNVYKVTDQASLIYEDNFSPLIPAKSFILAEDNQIAFISTGSELVVMNMTTGQEISNVTTGADPLILFPSGVLVMTEIIQTTDIFANKLSNLDLTLINMLDLSSPVVSKPIVINGVFPWNKPFAAKNDHLILQIGLYVNIYNSSDLTTLTQLSQTHVQSAISSMAVSPDGTLLFMIVPIDALNGFRLVIYDISDASNPTTQIGEVTLVDDNNMLNERPNIIISEDSNVTYVSLNEYVFIIDTIDKTAPSLVNCINLKYGNNVSMQVNPNLDLLLLTDGNALIKLVDMRAQYALSLSTQTFLVAGSFTSQLEILEKNAIGKYSLAQSSFKYSKMALYNIQTQRSQAFSIAYSKSPAWLDFNLQTGDFTASPTSKNDIGFYQIYAAISTPISESDFSSLTNETSDLILNLITYGYIDYDLYITSNFDPAQTLKFITSSFVSIEQPIRQVLTKHYFEMLTSVSVQSSLQLQLNSTHIQISSLSPFSVQLIITLSATQTTPPETTLAPTPRCRFMKDANFLLKPSFDLTNTTMTIEGPLSVINDILQVLTIDLNNTASCDGTVTIDDHLNPIQLNISVPDISNYFMLNPPLGENLELHYKMQNEADANTIYTGSYLLIEFNETRFLGRNLKYSLRTTGRTKSKDIYWLTLNGLSLSGVPPEQFWPWSYELEIVASNEYYETSSQVTLHVMWGFGYTLKMLGKLVIPFTIWIYLNIILNILFKKLYKYPKNFAIEVGQEISAHNIIPIACIAVDLKEAKIILKELQNFVAKHLDRKSITKTELVDFFVEPINQRINQKKLKEMIQSTVASLPLSKQLKLEYYTQLTGSRRDLIDQLVLNDIARTQLDSKQEKLTKQAFHQIKENWISLVEHKGGSHGWELSINQTELERQIQERGINVSRNLQKSHPKNTLELIPRTSLGKETNSKVIDLSASNIPDTVLSCDISKNLISKSAREVQHGHLNEQHESRVNLGLLNSALIAYAYRQHHLNVKMIDVSVVSREKTNDPWWLPGLLARFLKLDLRQILYALGDQLGYGIRYRVDYNVIHFFGTVKNNFERRNVVIQIYRKRRIIRELWLSGVADMSRQESVLNNKNL